MQPSNRRNALIVLVGATLALASLAHAQDEVPLRTPVRIELVFSKYQGEKVTARLPYSFIVNAGRDAGPTTFRMGIEVPVTVDGEGRQQYRNVGTNIDCHASPLGGGRFQVDLTFEQSSTYPAEPRDPQSGVEGNPLFRTFNSEVSVSLDDGKSMELASATDPISGEVSKVELSLKVVK